MDRSRAKPSFLRELIGLVLLALPLLVTVSAIEAADWVKGLPSLKALVLVSLVTWAFLARSAAPWWIGHPAAFLIGLVVAFVLGAFTLSESSGPGDLANRLADWFGAIGSLEGDRGTAMTGIFLMAVTLWLGHASVWLAYRRSHALPATLPGLGVLLVVLTFLPPDYYWYFFMYLLSVAPVIAYGQSGRWSLGGHRIALAGALTAGLVVMSITVGAAWRAPAPEGTVISLASKFEKSWYSFRGRWSNLFYGVPDRKDWPRFSPPHNLPYMGPIEPRDDVLFVVESQEPYRWRVRVYETYTGAGWVSDEDSAKVTTSELSSQSGLDEPKARKEVGIGVRMYSKGTTLVSVGEPLGADIPSKVMLSPKPSFDLYLTGSQNSYVPPELEKYRDALISWLVSHSPGGAPSIDLPDSGFEIVSDGALEEPQKLGTAPIVMARTEASPGPLLALRGKRTLVPPKQYKTVGSISEATPDMLREAGHQYPEWVTDRYLQLPNDFPDTVKELARQLIKDEDNSYDMAEAIREHLTAMPYTLDVAVPPEGQDGVEFFLLVQRRGYCQNYASAMITMLRSLDIPARLVIGFAPGIWDQERAAWVVQFRHYHAWPEVYFSGYGWVEFEPTPADVQPALEHLGIQPQGALVSLPPEFDPCNDVFGFEVCSDLDASGSQFDDFLDELPGQGVNPLVGGGSGGGSGGGFPSFWAVLGSVLGVLALLGVAYYIRRRLNELGYVTLTYASVCFLGRLGGVGLRPQNTPWEYCARLSRALPAHTQPIRYITERFVRTRYGGSHKEPYAEELRSVGLAWRTIRLALLRHILLRFLPRRQSPLALD